MARKRPKRRGLTAHTHDALVKRVFGDRRHAAGLLRAALDPAIVAHIGWGTLRTDKIEFIDRGLRGRRADLLFSARWAGRASTGRLYVRVVIEHQSTVESLMIFRMGSTMWRRWEHLVRENPRRTRLPLVIPVLLHHSDTGWTATTSFAPLLDVPEGAREASRRYIPDFEMKLIDVSDDPSGGVAAQALTEVGRLVLWALSVARDTPRLATELDQHARDVNAVYTTKKDRDAYVALLRYLQATHPDLGVEEMAEMLATTAKKGPKPVYVDPLEPLLRKSGAEGQARALLKQLTARFGDVPEATRQRILRATEPAIDRWLLQVLTAPTLEAVLHTPARKAAQKIAKKPARRTTSRQKPRASK